MTGEEHYLEAERLAQRAADAYETYEVEEEARFTARALLHATLAQAAAAYHATQGVDHRLYGGYSE